MNMLFNIQYLNEKVKLDLFSTGTTQYFESDYKKKNSKGIYFPLLSSPSKYNARIHYLYSSK